MTALHKCNLPSAHDVVKNGVDSRRHIVERTGHVEQMLVDHAELGVVVAVDEEQALHVERSPAHEECYHHCHCTKEIAKLIFHYTKLN